MKRWLGDTMSKRLVLLMWATLVASHLMAYAAVRAIHLPPREGGDLTMGQLPTFPSLPPTPGVPDSRIGRGPDGDTRHGPPRGDEGDGHADRPGPGVPMDLERGGPDGRDAEPHGEYDGPPALPWDALLLDYGVRFIVIAAAAWLGSRWLAAPMRRLVEASRSLGGSLDDHAAVTSLDERSGTREVREAAHVFNDMARQLRSQFHSRGLMVAAISHDLRTPLTRLRMRLESMDANPELQQRSISDIREMNYLIDNVLEIFRIEGPGSREAMQSTDVEALVQSLTDDLAEQQQPVRFRGEPAVTQTQPTALRRVLTNLIGNALRYGERADVTVIAHDGEVRIVVDDNGPGIQTDELDAVFEPFYRVEASRSRNTGGTGLGLYIARDLTRRQGGTLTLTNRPEGGLRAEVVLPRGR
ncbi:MAG: ATP-binding protein [Caldimonas sp.]